jgi:hypothetical protein
VNISEIFDFELNSMDSMSPVHFNVLNTHAKIELKVYVDMGNGNDASFCVSKMSGDRDRDEYHQNFRFWGKFD